jgi:hypothetical protein
LAAVGTVKRFTIGDTHYIADSRDQHWYWHTNGYWVKKKKIIVPSYNRFRATASGRGAPRRASFKSRLGSAASYGSPQKIPNTKQSPKATVGKASGAKRVYVNAMLAATTLEGTPTKSATVYAIAKGGPMIPGGYNWCHLIGHGAGGHDTPGNLVAASTHANSEMLEIEKILYRYKQKGVSVRVTAFLELNALHLAKSLKYDVFFDGTPIYSRLINGYRMDKPSYVEMGAVAANLSHAIYEAAASN